MSFAPHNLISLARWHFIIATFFEGAKYLHQIGLFTILDQAVYGLTGTIFSVAYLCATLAGLEQGAALVPHIQTILSTPQRNSYLADTFFYPQLIQHILGACAAGYFIIALTQQPLLGLATAAIALGEGLRYSLRPLVYAATKSHQIAHIEAGMSYVYILSVWLLWFIKPELITAITLSAGYATTSIISLSYLLYCGAQLLTQEAATKKDPTETQTTLPTRQELFKTQLALIATNLPHNLFSANFLVPFCAYHGGLTLASRLKITSEVAGAIKKILKSSIGFPLNAYAPTVRTTQDRRSLLTKITQATLPLRLALGSSITISLIFFLIPLPLPTKIIFSGFCLLIAADYLCMPYELLSIHTNTAGHIAGIRITEVIVDVLITIIFFKWPIILLGGISIARISAWYFMAHELERPALFFAALWGALKRITTQ